MSVDARVVRGSWSKGLGGLAAGVTAACGAPRIVQPELPAVAAASASAEGALEGAEPCAEAQGLMDRALRKAPSASWSCQNELANRAAVLLTAHPGRCEDLLIQARSTAAKALAEMLGPGSYLQNSPDGRWVLEGLGPSGHKLWEMTPTGPRLAWRIDVEGEVRFSGDRLFVLHGASSPQLTIIDLPSGATHPLAGVIGWRREGKLLLLVERHRLLKLDAETLEVLGTIESPAELSIGGEEDQLRWLAGGRFARVGSFLGAFETGKILDSGELRATSSDETKVMLCQLGEIIDFDLASWAPRRKFSQPSLCDVIKPSYAANDDLAVWFSTYGDQRILVVTLDLVSGEQREFEDPTHLFQGFRAGATMVAGTDRLCLNSVSKTIIPDECDWLIKAKRVVPSRAPPTPVRPPAPGASREEFGRALSPDKTQLAVLSAVPHRGPGEDHLSDLRLRIFEAKSLKKSREVVLYPKPFLWDSNHSWPFFSVRYPTPSRLFLTGPPSASGIYDLSTSTFTPLDAPDILGNESGPFVLLGQKGVLDARTMQTFPLAADEASFLRARRLAAACP